ncbi:MAG TPA: sigma-70 family RNA polymerase sigma factor [Desulfosporosinus sp.]|nr:sigma-70 family RNA polymerase sigma factor [Desulfosporosinus sp.]
MFPQETDRNYKLMNLLLKSGFAPITFHNQVEILLNGGEKFQALFNALEGASHHIHLSYFIFNDDEIGGDVLKILARKAAEGVEVRVLVDGLGSHSISGSFIRSMRQAGIQAEWFFPIRFPYITSRLNLRYHRKIVVVDGHTGFMGGLNIGDYSSFDEVYEIIFPIVYRFVSIRVPKADVEDVAAEIIMKIWRGLPDIEKKNFLKAWALKIAFHQIVDYYRTHKRMPAMTLEEIHKPLPQETDQSERWATLLSVGEALAQLSPQQVNVIQLRLIEGFSAGEVAGILGTTQQAVDSLLYRAKKGFRKIYQGNPDKGEIG